MTHPKYNALFTPANLAGLPLKNRFVMAPMTRGRAGSGGVPGEMNALYYAQRSEAGLIITEGTPPDPLGQGYLRIPGLYTADQVKGWRLVTDAVHEAGSKIFVQLMYVGRVSHPSFLGGVTPVGPSAIRAKGQVFTATGMQDFVTPRALSSDEVRDVVASYGRAARLADQAGFDGVELHATSGYLPLQFLLPHINQRNDEWGGSLENRARLTLEAVDTMVGVLGASRVGVRIGPEFGFNDAHDDSPKETYDYLLGELDKRGIAYIHVVDTKASDWNVLQWIRERFNGVIIANGGYDADRAHADLSEGHADLIAFGSAFLANPDLPTRLRDGHALAAADNSTFYTEGPEGYIDYPRHDGELPVSPYQQTEQLSKAS